MELQKNYYNSSGIMEEEFDIDLKKIFFVIWNRKTLVIKVFISVLIFFILLAFVLPKKYTVDADLYINKTNSSNMAEINPYFISEVGIGGGMAAMLAGGGNLSNELELMQSPLVIDKVIAENDIRFEKLFGIFPTVKTGQLMTTEKFLKKKISFEIKKGTNVVTVSYKHKDKELAYNIVKSIITNFTALHKELNSEKSKADKEILQTEYDRVKADLDKKMKTASGVPATAITGSGGISAMSAFSKSAQKAMSGIQEQYISGVKSEIALKEEAEKVAELAKKLEWAKLVENMSDSTNVVVLKEPRILKDYEQTSPKLLMNIILGIVFGAIASLGAVIFVENINKKLTYSMLGDNVIYDIEKDYRKLKYSLLAREDKKILFAMFDNISPNIYTQLKEFKNISMIKGDVSSEFISVAKNVDEIMAVVKIGNTDSELYKEVKAMLGEINKNITKEILV